MKAVVLVFVTVAALLGGALFGAQAALAATPIVGGTSFDTAVVVSPLVEYSGALSGTHKADYFYFDVTAGQMATVYFTSTTTWVNATFYLYDQAHTGQLASKFVNGPSQSNQFSYIGNNTTPTRYYFRVETAQNAANQYLFQFKLADQADANMPGDAGDTQPTARVITPGQGETTVYASNTLGNVDMHDWYRIDAVPGQILTATVSVLDYAGQGNVFVELKDLGGPTLGNGSRRTPDTSPIAFSWMSNNTTPSAYLLHVSIASSAGTMPVRYSFDVTLDRQNDAGEAGDAGDSFDTARSVTVTDNNPRFDATTNKLGGSDKDDYYMVTLPPPPPGQLPKPYRFSLDSIVWPAGSGFLRIDFYDSQRNLIGRMTKVIQAPSTSPHTVDMTECGTQGCYVKITTGFATNKWVQYAIHVVPPNFVYLPIIMKRR